MAAPDTSLTTIAALRHASGEVVADTASKVDALRCHYQALATPVPASDAPDALPPHALAHHAEVERTVRNILDNPEAGDPRQDGAFTEEEVTRAVDKLKRYKAAGQDNIPPELLKSGGPALCVFLTHLFNIIWKAECVPTAWRKGVIVSLYKAGDRTDCGNYRPITLLPVIDKLFAAILAARLQSTVALHDHQFAFRPRRGTMDPLFILSSLLQHRKATKHNTHAFFLDIKKAYDTVWHSGLLFKLHRKGVRGKMWRVIHDLYTKCASAPRLDGHTAEPFPVSQGVAQGCPMSCILFDIFIDDLVASLQSDGTADGVPLTQSTGAVTGTVCVLAFADDITTVSGTRGGLQRHIDRTHEHSVLWKWSANTNKCHAISFPASGTPAPVPPALAPAPAPPDPAPTPVPPAPAPAPVPPAPTWTWVGTPLPTTRTHGTLVLC
jgi:hypothetical protein